MSDSLSIKLNSGSKSILKVGFLIRALFFLLFTIGIALFGLHVMKDSLVLALICFALSLGVFFVFYSILNAAFFSETLTVTKHELTILHKSVGSVKTTVVKLNEILYFGFANQQYTKHAMDSPIIDITGLATREKELQYVIDEGNITIETATKTIKFGKNMPSWDVEEVVEEIEAFTGIKFKTPIPQRFKEKETEEFEDPMVEEPGSEQEPLSEEENVKPQAILKTESYQGDYGTLTIEQKKEIPSSEDRAFLNGKLAATGKYQIGDKKFVMISNGYIYAVRGFSEPM